MTLWLVTSRACQVSAVVLDGPWSGASASSHTDTLPMGQQAYVHLIQFQSDAVLSDSQCMHYELIFENPQHQRSWNNEKKEVCYPGQSHLSVHWQPEIHNLLHGSCRKPHHPAADALLRADELVAGEFTSGQRRPNALMLTGDQIYTDDVAGPTLLLIQQVIELLGLFEEPLDGALIANSRELPTHPYNLNQRQKLLPQIEMNTALSKLFFGAKKKPVFTSVNAQNHLISFAEIMSMYLLVWSPVLWRLLPLPETPPDVQDPDRFNSERNTIGEFSQGLVRVRRMMAHLPSYMIFDDHDITDDWNLTRGWEQEVYGHPLSRRMVGNALMAYWLCQGWGNQPDKFGEVLTHARRVFRPEGLQDQDGFIDRLLDYDEWHYQVPCTPLVYVLDTRTQRWRSESSLNKPSGLMDWEALCEFQQALIGKDTVIVVSAAPVYGVKMIEAIQKVFTFFGKALTVDAENWMAHKGTANVMLNIFRHHKTPPEFIILSGDVHYSFVYDVRLRFRRNSPHITQFTCSGIKNTFPPKLLGILDSLNRLLYGPKSLLNLFTRRRNMLVRARTPSLAPRQTLLNRAALGQLLFSDDHRKVTCRALCSDGETVEFRPEKRHAKKD